MCRRAQCFAGDQYWRQTLVTDGCDVTARSNDLAKVKFEISILLLRII